MPCVGVVVSAVQRLAGATIDGVALEDWALDAMTRACGSAQVLAAPDLGKRWSDLAKAADGGVLVVHDACCPMVTPRFIATMVSAAAAQPEAAHIAFRSVTDTIKTVDGICVATTLDRDTLAAPAAPLVLGSEALRALVGQSASAPNLPTLVPWLAQRVALRWVEAEPLGRRVDDEATLRVLTALAATRRSAAS